MAHELSIDTNGKAEMAFVGQTPWHGLGQSVTEGASIGVWMKEAGMDWEAHEGIPVAYANDVRDTDHIDFSDYKALWRSDTKVPLGIVGTGYNVVQPREVLEFFRDLTESGKWAIHTAGVLRGGRKVWAMATNKQQASLGGKKGKGADVLMNNLVLATSLDGSMKTTIIDTCVRVVCANTFAMALRDNKGLATISHRSVFDADAVKKAMGLAEGTFEKFMATAKDLADTPVDMREAQDLLAQVFQPKPKAVDLSWMGKISALGTSDEDVTTRAMDSVLALFKGAGMGADLSSSKGTRWGLFNAVTEHVDHDMGRTDDTRLDSAWFGRGAAIKAKTMEVLTA